MQIIYFSGEERRMVRGEWDPSEIGVGDYRGK